MSTTFFDHFIHVRPEFTDLRFHDRKSVAHMVVISTDFCQKRCSTRIAIVSFALWRRG